MTNPTIKELRELCKQPPEHSYECLHGKLGPCKRCYIDGNLLEASRTAIPLLIDEIERLREALHKIEDYNTLDGDKYVSYESGWYGVATFARKALQESKERVK